MSALNALNSIVEPLLTEGGLRKHRTGYWVRVGTLWVSSRRNNIIQFAPRIIYGSFGNEHSDWLLDTVKSFQLINKRVLRSGRACDTPLPYFQCPQQLLVFF